MKNFKEKLLAIFSKSIFTIQFILCLIECVLLFKIIINKITLGNLNATYIILFIAVGISILINMYFAIKKYNKIIEKMFLLFAIPIGLLYMVFLIPTFAPDENYHAYRAYQISEGDLIVEIASDGTTETLIPEDLIHAGIDRRNE